MNELFPKLILGSGSPRRRELLREAGYMFDVVAPDPLVEEGLCSACGPVELVLQLAIAKAAEVARQIGAGERTRDVVVLTADTVAECQGQILGKPRHEAHARQMLELMRGRNHQVLTGFCVCTIDSDWSPSEPTPSNAQVEYVATSLKMDAISDEQIDDYLDSGGWKGKAGGFGYQDRLGWIHIHEGSESNVVGLPMERISELLAERNVSPGSELPASDS